MHENCFEFLLNDLTFNTTNSNMLDNSDGGKEKMHG